MLIERLRLVVEEVEAAAWAARLLEGVPELSGPRLTFIPGRIRLEGFIQVPVAGRVRFGTAWTMAAEQGFVIATLRETSVFGWSGLSGFLNTLVMGRLRDALAGRAGVAVEDHRIRLDPNALAGSLPVSVRFKVSAVAVEAGRLVVETA